MKQYIYDNLQYLPDINQAFKFILDTCTYTKKDKTVKPFWDEIISLMSYCHEKNGQFTKRMPKNFISFKEFIFLENMGIDYNYCDYAGNNFLHYVVSGLNPHSTNSIKFLGNALDYVLDKTSNIYLVNNANKHILFNLMDINNGGIKGEKFFNFINKYPDFDLHIMSHDGNNLLNQAINDSAIEISRYLIEQNLSTTHTNKNDSNILYNFQFLPANKKVVKLFNELLLNHDITQPTKYDKNLVNTWLEWITSDKNNGSAMKYHDWLNKTLTQFIDEKFYYTHESLHTLRESLNNHQDSYNIFCHQNLDTVAAMQAIHHYDDAKVHLTYMILQNHVATKTNILTNNKTVFKI